MSVVTAIQLDFAQVSLYEDHLVLIFNQGVHVTVDMSHAILALAQEHFHNKPFTYISHRKNEYSIDPSAYREASKIENLKAIAVVSHEGIGLNSVNLEKHFFSKPFKHFLKLKDARSWIREEIMIS